MKEIPVTKTLLRKGLNSRNQRREIINYNNICKLANKLKEKEMPVSKNKFSISMVKKDNQVEDNSKLNNSMKKLIYLEKRSFFNE